MEKKIKNFWHGRFIRYVPIILWVGVILFASTTAASMSSTSRFIRPLLEFLLPEASEATLLVYHGFIRKLAHLGEYAVLALLASRAFRLSSRETLRTYWPAAAMLIVLLTASADEINQSFIPTRTGSVYDVVLDGLGGLLMISSILLYSAFGCRSRRHSRHRKSLTGKAT